MRNTIAAWAKLHQQGTMREIELRSELMKLFQQTLKGRDVMRAVKNAELYAMRNLKRSIG